MPKRPGFPKLSVQAAHHQSLISRRNLILQNLEHGKHRKILQTCRDNLSLKRSTAADFIAVESCFFRRLPVFDLQYYIPELRSARGEDMSSHQNSSIRSAAQGLATTIRKWYLSPHGHWHRIHSGFYQGMFECIKNSCVCTALLSLSNYRKCNAPWRLKWQNENQIDLLWIVHASISSTINQLNLSEALNLKKKSNQGSVFILS